MEEEKKDVDLTPDLEPQLTEEDLKDTTVLGSEVESLEQE